MSFVFPEPPGTQSWLGCTQVLVEGMRPRLCLQFRNDPGKTLFCERGSQSQSRSSHLRGEGGLGRWEPGLMRGSRRWGDRNQARCDWSRASCSEHQAACPLLFVGLGCPQREEAVSGIVGCEGRVCFHVSELWVFGLATLYFVDCSVENHFEPLLPGLEGGNSSPSSEASEEHCVSSMTHCNSACG